jgi:hypothetical protein
MCIVIIINNSVFCIEDFLCCNSLSCIINAVFVLLFVTWLLATFAKSEGWTLTVLKMPTSTLCWIGGKLLLTVLNVDNLILGRQRYIQLSHYSLWPVLLGLNWKGVNCWHLSKSAELIQVGTQCSEIQKLSDSAWNKDWLPKRWTEALPVSVYGRGNTTDCNNCWDNYIQNFI